MSLGTVHILTKNNYSKNSFGVVNYRCITPFKGFESLGDKLMDVLPLLLRGDLITGHGSVTIVDFVVEGFNDTSNLL